MGQSEDELAVTLLFGLLFFFVLIFNCVMLSQRAQVYLGEPEFLMKCLCKCASDNYSKSNPEGYVNLGTAVNGLCEELLSERLRRHDLWRHESDWQHYFGLNGTPDLLRVTTNFLQERLAQGEKLSAENLRMVNGVSGGLEALAWIISDPGDVVIVPTPTYARFFCRHEREDADEGGWDAPGGGLCA